MACQENDFVKYEFRNYLLTITIKKEFPESDEEWNHSMTLLQCYYEAAKQGNYKYSIIFDIRKLGLLNISYYWDCSKIFTENKEITENHIIKTGIITSNTIVKNSLNLFFTLCPPTRPLQFLTSSEEISDFTILNIRI